MLRIYNVRGTWPGLRAQTRRGSSPAWKSGLGTQCSSENRQRGHPVRTAGVIKFVHLTLRLIQPVVFVHFVPVDFDPETCSGGHVKVPVAIAERNGDDVVHLIVIMAVHRVDHRWRRSGEVKHRCRGDSQLAITVHADSELKSVAHCDHTLVFAEPAPEMHIGENDIDATHPNSCRELFKAD